MASTAADSEEVEIDVPGLFRLYKNGRFLRFGGTEKLPAAPDPATGVDSKDAAIDPAAAGVSARLYLPPVVSGQKLPVLVYFHGGAFCAESPASPIYHRHLNTLSSLTPLIAVSVDYRLAPESSSPATAPAATSPTTWRCAPGKKRRRS